MSKSKRKEKTLNLACLSNVIGESFKVLGGRRETNRGEIESLAHICHVRRANNNRGPFCTTSSLSVFFFFSFFKWFKNKKNSNPIKLWSTTLRVQPFSDCDRNVKYLTGQKTKKKQKRASPSSNFFLIFKIWNPFVDEVPFSFFFFVFFSGRRRRPTVCVDDVFWEPKDCVFMYSLKNFVDDFFFSRS